MGCVFALVTESKVENTAVEFFFVFVFFFTKEIKLNSEYVFIFKFDFIGY